MSGCPQATAARPKPEPVDPRDKRIADERDVPFLGRRAGRAEAIVESKEVGVSLGHRTADGRRDEVMAIKFEAAPQLSVKQTWAAPGIARVIYIRSTRTAGDCCRRG